MNPYGKRLKINFCYNLLMKNCFIKCIIVSCLRLRTILVNEAGSGAVVINFCYNLLMKNCFIKCLIVSCLRLKTILVNEAGSGAVV